MIRISDAELEVMKVIWTRKEATSVEIIEDLKSFNWNFNTIRTLIKRLEKKGAIEIVKKQGKMYTYRSAIDESKYKNEATINLLKKLYNNSINEFILDYSKNSSKEKEEVKEVIKNVMKQVEEKKKNKK